ncbi:hypothetical protein COCOBI_17-2000 [Coccomyxa sp. Obi]|nr:hypothetical protein COCOBI_17-2000 [Coccomyxa sp. Obi]
MESREREKRMCAALQSRITLTEAGKLARVPPGHRFRKPGVEKAYGRVLETTESVEAIQRQAYLLDEEDGADAFPKLLELIDTGTDIAEVRTDDIEDDSWDVDSACSATSAKPADSPATKPAPKYVKGRLKAKLAFWQLFCKSAVVLSWISSGYEIPWALGVTPPPLSFPNAAGALQREAFVSAEIAYLLARGSIMRTHLPPAVISPLNVVERRGKLRLILDLVYVNRFIDQTGLKFKYENIRSASL